MTTAQLLLFGRITAVLTFAVSALAKARDLDAFHATIRAFKVAGDRQARVLAPAVVGLELLIAVGAAIGGRLAVPAMAAATLLLAAYTALLATARAHGSTVGCNCFGNKPQPLSWYDVARNVLLLTAVGAALSAGLRHPTALASYDIGLVAAAALAWVLLAVNLAPVVDTLRRPIAIEEQL